MKRHSLHGVRRKWDELHAKWLLRHASVGERPRVSGYPLIKNYTELRIGDDFWLGSSPARSHIVVEGGRAVIGNRVSISYGAAIYCQREVLLGDDCQVGPFSVIHDSDFHAVGQRDAREEPLPVRIGDRVRIGSRVTVMRGTTIEDDVTVIGGSVVSGHIPRGSVVGGVPARSLAASPADEPGDVPSLVMRVLGLREPPALDDGPDQLPSWDSLGSLKLLLALEDTYGVSIGEEAMKKATSVRSLSSIVEQEGIRRAQLQ